MCELTLLPRFFKKHNKSKLYIEQQTAFIGLKIMWSISVKKLLRRETFHKDIENERRRTV